MTKVKRAVTIDADVEREARRMAGDNFSAFVEESLRRNLQRTKLRALVDDYERECGPIPQEVKDQVSRELEELRRS